MTSQKNVRLIGEAGAGPVIVMLRASATPSKAAAVLAKGFRVLSFAVDPKTGAGDTPKELASSLAGLKVAETALVADASTASVAVATANAYPELVQSVSLLSPVDVGDAADVKVPVLAMFGTKGEVRSPGAARAVCKSIPNCRMVYVYDADRIVDDERPEAVAAALEDFAVRREGYLVNSRRGGLYP